MIIIAPSSFFLRYISYVVHLSKIISVIFLWQVTSDLILNFS